MAAAGLELDDVSEVVLTHAHGDHIDGLVHVRGRVLIHEKELRVPRISDGAGDAPRPAPAAPHRRSHPSPSRSTTARSARLREAAALSDDGRIVAVDTPGHTPGHISVICVDDVRPARNARRRHNRLARAALRAARRRGRTRPQGAHRNDADDPRSLRGAPDDLPALTRPRLSGPIRTTRPRPPRPRSPSPDQPPSASCASRTMARRPRRPLTSRALPGLVENKRAPPACAPTGSRDRGRSGPAGDRPSCLPYRPGVADQRDLGQRGRIDCARPRVGARAGGAHDRGHRRRTGANGIAGNSGAWRARHGRTRNRTRRPRRRRSTRRRWLARRRRGFPLGGGSRFDDGGCVLSWPRTSRWSGPAFARCWTPRATSR